MRDAKFMVSSIIEERNYYVCTFRSLVSFALVKFKSFGFDTDRSDRLSICQCQCQFASEVSECGTAGFWR